jgi:hypothetical protein
MARSFFAIGKANRYHTKAGHATARRRRRLLKFIESEAEKSARKKEELAISESKLMRPEFFRRAQGQSKGLFSRIKDSIRGVIGKVKQ